MRARYDKGREKMSHTDELTRQLKEYTPYNEQEARDRDAIVAFVACAGVDPYSRENLTAHLTASAWILNREHTKVLMVYHNLYDSWSWTGGHADGEHDLLHVALKEAREETGVEHIRPLSDEIFSVECLTVDGHEKRGQYVPSHIHMNVTYLLEADERDTLHVCEGENSGVKWFALDDALKASSEPWFVERIYKKLNEKLAGIEFSR